jgi:hypothetical protein
VVGYNLAKVATGVQIPYGAPFKFFSLQTIIMKKEDPIDMKKMSAYISHMLNRTLAARGSLSGHTNEYAERFKTEYESMTPKERSKADKEAKRYLN